MKIQEVRLKYPEYKISYMAYNDYLVGMKSIHNQEVRDETKYEDVFVASKDKKFWLLYIDGRKMTGHFESKQKAVDWFKHGGR
jgi:uncharacterized protein YlbG (UPF0298 family)